MSVSSLECNRDSFRSVGFVEVPCSEAESGDGSDRERVMIDVGAERDLLLLLGTGQPEEDQGNRRELGDRYECHHHHDSIYSIYSMLNEMLKI